LITLLAAIAVGQTVQSELLDNGARIVAISIPGSQSFSAQTFVRAGSAFETPENQGATHSLEHLLFAGGSADEIAENAGCLLNATTYREFMRLYASGPSPAWQSGLRAVARLFETPHWAAAAKEAEVIRQEASLRLLDPDNRAFEGLLAALMAGSAWAHNPVGAGVVAGLQEMRSRHFTGRNVVTVVAGDIDTRAVLAELRKAYATLPPGDALEPPAIPNFEVLRMEGVEDRVAVAATGVGFGDLRRYLAMELVVDALTSPARLDALGLDARSFFGPSSGGVPVVLSYRSLDGAPGLEARVRRALDGGISDSEFAIGLARLRSRYLAGSAESAAISEGLGFLLTGKRLAFDSEIAQLSKADIDIALDRFKPAKLAWSVGK